MATKTSISIKDAVTLAKPFVGSLRGKNHARAILKAALVTPEYVIATDSHRLIRIRHNADTVIAKMDSYLHHYNKEISGAYPASSYPQTERIIPDKYNAQKEILFGVKQWLEIHEGGLIAAKEHKNNVIELRENVFEVPPCTMKAVKGKKTDYSSTHGRGYKDVPVPEFDQLSYKYTIPFSTAIEYVAYNCQYMLDALKVFKKLGCTQAKLYFFGKNRPMLLCSENVEILIMPVRK